MRTLLLPIVSGLVLAPCLLVAGCDRGPTDSPTLCVYAAASQSSGGSEQEPCVEPAEVDGKESNIEGNDITCATTIRDGQVFFVEHRLPKDVLPPGPVSLRIQTPCGEAVHEVPYAGGVAKWSQQAPAGANCVLSVTATIANSELRCDIGLDAGTCPDPDSGDLCPEDSGVGGGNP